jgi:hypothetical protein
MQRQNVTSSNVKSMGWLNNTLEVEYHDGSIYHYHNVPASKHAALMAESGKTNGSVGSLLSRTVKGRHGFTKVSK